MNSESGAVLDMKMDMREWNEFSMQSKNFTEIAASSEVTLSESGLVRGLFIKYDLYKYDMILEITKDLSQPRTIWVAFLLSKRLI